MRENLYEKLEFIWYEYICAFWDWFWYYRVGKVKFRVVELDGMYNVTASTKNRTVFNCYGSTLEMAKQVAMFRLNNRGSSIKLDLESLKGYSGRLDLLDLETYHDDN